MKLREEVDLIHKKKSFILDKQQTDLRNYRETLTSLSSCGEEAISSNHHINILSVHSNISKTLENDHHFFPSLRPLTNSSVKFVSSNIENVVSAIDHFGRVQENKVSREKTTAEGEGLVRVKGRETGVFLITTRNEEGEKVYEEEGEEEEGVIEVEVVGEGSESEGDDDDVAEVKMTDKKDGTYEVGYRLGEKRRRERVSVWVRVRGEHIGGSPFVVEVEWKREKE